MTPNEIEQIIETAIVRGNMIKWWYLVAWMLVAGIGAYFGTYLREKGKNVATKEDIGRITDEIEKVRSTYVKEIEAISATKIRMQMTK